MLRENLVDIEKQITAVTQLAAGMRKTEPSQVRDTNGNFVLIPLLLAKANCLHALSILQNGTNNG